MDVMRSVLMLLGIVLHASLIFSVSSTWAITDPEPSIIFNAIKESITSFRMPAFFIVSGFFCHLTLKKYGAEKFTRLRLQRILIPTLTVAITFNSIQYFLLKDYHQVEYSYFELFTLNYWLAGNWIGHLWFLINLLVYFGIATCFYVLLRHETIASFADKMVEKISNVSFYLIFLLLPLITYLTDFISYRVPDISALESVDILSLYELMHYSSFFLFGILLGASAKLIEEFTRVRLLPIITLVISACYLIFVEYQNHGIIGKSVARYADAMICWSLSCLCFAFFAKLFNRESSIFRYLSDASYSIYLFHHLLVILLGMLLIPLNIPTIIKFVIIIVSVSLFSLALHHFLVLRINLLRVLFNGKQVASPSS